MTQFRDAGKDTARGWIDHRSNLINGGAAGPQKGTVLGIGDSWLDYPKWAAGNLRQSLERRGWDVYDLADNGARLSEIAYEDGKQEKIVRAFQKTRDAGKQLRGVFLSGGGNDLVAVMEFLLNHRKSGLPDLSANVLQALFEEKLPAALHFLIGALDEYALHYYGTIFPIVTHGYDYPYPTGEGFLSGFGPLPGPWLKPPFVTQGFNGDDVDGNHLLLTRVIDAWNAQLEQVAAVIPHLHYLDFRGTLTREDWNDELHPTGDGFEALGEKADAKLVEVTL